MNEDKPCLISCTKNVHVFALTMPLEEFIISVYCMIDDLYSSTISELIRKRGTSPKLFDGEVLKMEIIAEWLGIHEDKAIWKYFRWDWLHFFPTLPDRSQFVRQGANHWWVKQLLQGYVCIRLWLLLMALPA